ncbi:hypothetical protein KR222_005822 [Zaprionus bogoriensis]|nr:hypothetical protein KR222_005822 [Zaprionus bogoriensis]
MFDEEDYLPPRNTHMLAIPNDEKLLRVKELYNTSKGTMRLHSERNRDTYAEALIDNVRLGTLADLCVRALAKLGTHQIALPVQQDPLKLRIHYDSLDVELPLKDCYFVEDLHFWRRVVLAKSDDKSLPLKGIDEYDWRGTGISLKYVEMVEACPAAFWPERKMAELGHMVCKYVYKMHIRHLQSLTDRSFMHYMDSGSELEASSDEPDFSEISSDEKDTTEEEGGEEEDAENHASKSSASIHVRILPTFSLDQRFTTEEGSHSGEEEARIEPDNEQQKRREARQSLNEARQQLRDMRSEQKLERDRRAIQRQSPRLQEKPPKKKRGKNRPVSGIFDMKVPPEPEDGEDKIVDGRNKDKLLQRLKRYDYPPKHCHHIDLSFVRYFNRLSSLEIEFLGPKTHFGYHKRHLNFSYDDMTRLAKGLSSLSRLKIFRLRNSRMDNMKLLILCRTLMRMDSLEVVDFGYDQLQDDCHVALRLLLQRNIMLKALELEYNNLGNNSLSSLGYALKCHAGANTSGRHLEYLGLAHNYIRGHGLNLLFSDIVGTEHVKELNINGVGLSSGVLSSQVSLLLRNHTPLRRLDMAANILSERDGLEVIRALESNSKVIHFDCRACDLSEHAEFEADMIVRRNNYIADHPYLGDDTQTKEKVLNYLASLRHPIRAKLEKEKAKLAACLRCRPTKSSSELSVQEEVQEEQQEQEYDIWKAFGVHTSNSVVYAERVLTEQPSHSSEKHFSFAYNPNEFTLQQFREHLLRPGPSERYYYLKHAGGNDDLY